MTNLQTDPFLTAGYLKKKEEKRTEPRQKKYLWTVASDNANHPAHSRSLISLCWAHFG